MATIAGYGFFKNDFGQRRRAGLRKIALTNSQRGNHNFPNGLTPKVAELIAKQTAEHEARAKRREAYNTHNTNVMVADEDSRHGLNSRDSQSSMGDDSSDQYDSEEYFAYYTEHDDVAGQDKGNASNEADVTSNPAYSTVDDLILPQLPPLDEETLHRLSYCVREEATAREFPLAVQTEMPPVPYDRDTSSHASDTNSENLVSPHDTFESTP